jgi:hypothetical protein
MKEYPMTRTLAATFLALMLAITSTTSAQAETYSNRNGEQVVGGLLALLLLGAVIKHASDDDDDDRARPRPPGGGNGSGHSSHRILPVQCLTNYNTSRGPQRLLSRACLRQNYSNVNRLPNVCATRVWTSRGERRGFLPRCLRRQGFRIARN